MQETDLLTGEYQSLASPNEPLGRRGFLVTALGAGFALAVQPVQAQTAIHTDDWDLDAGEVRIPTAEGFMPAYRAQPAEGGQFPVILVVQEIFGVHEYIKDTCRRLAQLGYQAIAPELYARQGDPRQYANIGDILAKVVSRVPDSQVMSDLDACVAWSKVNGGDTARLGVTGFCWGGRITWLYAAHNPNVKAGVAWYGRLTADATAMTPRHPLDLAGKLHGPVLGLYGGQDTGIPQDTVERMRQTLAASDNPASRASQIHVYPNAPHAFHADYRPSYREVEALDGWQRLQDWFKTHGL
ncbi:MAG TPA: dienelactone hydrolase family protein [Thiobacillaceae bacterium]|nr:dienelactone hydrolase family protein [Thiobacillaceae bacterium]HNU63410.1 dienelactone hydrolase family protein [Thiobacillaceae bacterium]